MTLYEEIKAALADQEISTAAIAARDLVAAYLGREPDRLPGMDTATRCAHRIYHGMTVEQAAAREYSYRWHLPLNQWINHAESKSRSMPITGAWRPPHLIGM